jgi:hypothetical protein
VLATPAGRANQVSYPRALVAADHHVVGLEVAMHQPRVVDRRQPATRRDEHAEDLAPTALLLAQPMRQRRSLHPLHGDEQLLVPDTDFIDVHDVRMRHAGQRLRFADQALIELGRRL